MQTVASLKTTRIFRHIFNKSMYAYMFLLQKIDKDWLYFGIQICFALAFYPETLVFLSKHLLEVDNDKFRQNIWCR